MAGMPQRRARLERERLFAAPAVIPPAEFRNLTAGQKMEHLLGCSLDDAYIISHWDTNKADVHQLSAKVRLIEIMTKHGFRFAVEAMRDQGRDRAIEQLAQAITDRVVTKDHLWQTYNEHDQSYRCSRCGVMQGPGYLDPPPSCTSVPTTDRVSSDVVPPGTAGASIPTYTPGSGDEPGHTQDTKDVTP